MSLYQKPEEPIELFFLYVSQDKKICDDLQKHLWQSMRGGRIRWWYDDLILPGQVKELEIQTHLNRADICVVLVSPDFVASDYCDGTTMTLALNRHNAGDICVIPVIARAVEWKDTPFGDLQQLPKGTRAIMSRRNYDEALKEVADGIREVLNARTRRSSTQQVLRAYPKTYATMMTKIQEVNTHGTNLSLESQRCFVGTGETLDPGSLAPSQRRPTSRR